MSVITVEQLGELIAQSKAGRVTRENLQAYLCNPVGVDYSISVDYGKSIKEMLLAGSYYFDDERTFDDDFSTYTRYENCPKTVIMELVHLEGITSEAVLNHLKSNKMRPAMIKEFLAFMAMFPEIQKKYAVVCLGSSCSIPNGCRCVPYIYSGRKYVSSDRPELQIRDFDDAWGIGYPFLAVSCPIF